MVHSRLIDYFCPRWIFILGSLWYAHQNAKYVEFNQIETKQKYLYWITE